MPPEPSPTSSPAGTRGARSSGTTRTAKSTSSSSSRRCEKHGARVLAYCLMPNHVHLALQTGSVPISRVVHDVHSRYAQYFNRRHDRSGHLFQGRFQAFVIDRESYLLEVVRYIHRNPVKARLAARPEDFPWSSHRSYLGTAPAWLSTGEALSLLAGSRPRARRLFQEFVAGTESGRYDPDEARLGAVVGSDDFVRAALSRAGRSDLVRRTVTVETVTQLVAGAGRGGARRPLRTEPTEAPLSCEEPLRAPRPRGRRHSPREDGAFLPSRPVDAVARRRAARASPWRGPGRGAAVRGSARPADRLTGAGRPGRAGWPVRAAGSLEAGTVLRHYNTRLHAWHRIVVYRNRVPPWRESIRGCGACCSSTSTTRCSTTGARRSARSGRRSRGSATVFGGVSFDAWLAAYRRANGLLWAAYGKGEIGREELHRRRFSDPLGAFGLEEDAADRVGAFYLERYRRAWQLNEGAEELLAAASEQGEVGVLSNGFRELQRAKLARFGLERWVRHVVLSEEVGAMKPVARDLRRGGPRGVPRRGRGRPAEALPRRPLRDGRRRRPRRRLAPRPLQPRPRPASRARSSTSPGSRTRYRCWPEPPPRCPASLSSRSARAGRPSRRRRRGGAARRESREPPSPRRPRAPSEACRGPSGRARSTRRAESSDARKAT